MPPCATARSTATPIYDRDEEFFAFRPPGAGPEIVVKVLVRFAAVELTMAVHTPRTFEATIGEIAEPVRDVRAALAGVVS
jgi:hypothetical protein